MSQLRKHLKPTADLHKHILGIISSNSKQIGQGATAQYIADCLNISTSTVYNHLRQARLDGVGVHSIPRGLILSNHATRIDDVKEMLKFAIRRQGIIIEANAVAPHIQKRWPKNEACMLESLNGATGNVNEWRRRIDALYKRKQEDFEATT